jgi:hypothetical protein
MKIYVLTRKEASYAIEEYLDVCTVESIVLSWAGEYRGRTNYICTIRDDVGIKIGTVDLVRTLAARRVVTA